MSSCYLKEGCKRYLNGYCLNDCPCYEPIAANLIEDTRKDYICPMCNFEWKTTETENVICACGNKMVLKEKYYAIS